ncbi:hypothetical protein [Tateyamaria pelophila]|uniref:hypothetical protein n=1 Tax=Tateyamaria pelophila TaxID=328415 RepID=UPI001CBE5CE9|nr:hypothetical protein [Tateyamaria pelophila]
MTDEDNSPDLPPSRAELRERLAALDDRLRSVMGDRDAWLLDQVSTQTKQSDKELDDLKAKLRSKNRAAAWIIAANIALGGSFLGDIFDPYESLLGSFSDQSQINWDDEEARSLLFDDCETQVASVYRLEVGGVRPSVRKIETSNTTRNRFEFTYALADASLVLICEEIITNMGRVATVISYERRPTL